MALSCRNAKEGGKGNSASSEGLFVKGDTIQQESKSEETRQGKDSAVHKAHPAHAQSTSVLPPWERLSALGGWDTVSLFFGLLKIVHVCMPERARVGAEGEAESPQSREPNMRLDPRPRRS